MRNTFTKISIALIFTFFTLIAFTQPANDECINAIVIQNPVTYCSNAGEYTNINATTSGTAVPACWATSIEDVWFSFSAVATDVSVVVLGDVNGQNWGTMSSPEVAIYDDCAANELACVSDVTSIGSIQLFANNLTVGQTYYIRVDSRSNTSGTFRLCMDNYNSPATPNSDCSTGIVLCDKSNFTVQSVVGVGTNANELPTSACIGQEYASVWYKWVCDSSGTLAFTLNPNNPDEDLDFMVFELPNGLNDCANKMELRCMGSGENVGQPLSNWIACTGATGLSLTDTDIVEQPGCAAGDNNFVAALNMTSGTAYALVVNNFSNSGNGFSVTWGGTGTFLGPDVDFTISVDTICVGQSITIQNNSNNPSGTFTSLNWNFGQHSTLDSSTLQGNHIVTYNKAGTKYITLKATTNAGCQVTKTVKLIVECCASNGVDIIVKDSLINDVIGSMLGSIDITVVGGNLPYSYLWSNGDTAQDLTGLDIGFYSVTITDAIGCQGNYSFGIVDTKSTLEFTIFDVFPNPTDGQLTLNAEFESPLDDVIIEVIGINGQVLKQLKLGSSISNINQPIDLSTYSSGNYFIVLRSENGYAVKQVILKK